MATETLNVTNVTEEVNVLVEKGLKALDEFLKITDQEKIDEIVEAAAAAALEAKEPLAKLAVEETKRGVFEDKVIKNEFGAQAVAESLRGVKTVGIIEKDEELGLTSIADPVGVICGITPVTNPTSTTIVKALISLKSRNPIIFSAHPAAKECSKEAARIVRDAAVKAGAPENCIQFIEEPTLEGTDALMKHEGVSLILATGGNGLVRAAYSCGKPALGVGAGNVPAYVHKSAKLEQAATDIVFSKSFDNGVICSSEQAAIVDKEVYDEFVELIKAKDVYVVNEKEKALLENFLFGAEANSESCSGAKLNAAVVGQDATRIAELAGFEVPETTKVLAAECPDVGLNQPLTREKLSPVLALVKSEDAKDGLDKASRMVELFGLGHTAVVHTEDEEVAVEFGKLVKAIRILWNTPSGFGSIGAIYTNLTPSLTLGCGTYGRNSFSGNVSAVNLLNIKKIAKRKPGV
ncbi:MAG: aldehyde dehydrogenase family protein [Gemella sp.]|nr:aldehyde dehydrogenase family protein [Gemella sp.]